MLHEFLYDYKVYAVVEAGQFIGSPDKNQNKDRHVVEIFKTLGETQAFFKKVAQDPISRDDILRIAEWVKPSYCRPPKNSSKPDSQELLNLLSLRVYNGAYLLLEIKPPLKFEECCVKSIKQINGVIKNGKIASVVLCIAQVNSIFASHTRLPSLISALSSAYNATIDTNWERLPNAIKGLNDITRKSIAEISKYEYFEHGEKENDKELGKYWERIYNEFNK